ncbi:hypothetical protein AVEN_216942-1 [Araneus ventricosus]|uniref:Uncharacterized protein n=1 Tax=Araneus ventricosus TaxID=182803 RepID=A0A4Y2VBI9_ARAVE|nr:hypothetical protein AVEN_216942-1 [Araneus ventricosus]
MRLLTDSEDDSEESNERQNIEIAVDGTIWKKMKTSSSTGRPPLHPDNFGDYLHSNTKASNLLVEIVPGEFWGIYLAQGLLLSEDPICGVTECLQDALILHIARVHNTR